MPVRNIEYGCNTPSAEVLGSLRAVYTTAMVEAGLSFADVSLMLDSTNAHLQLPVRQMGFLGWCDWFFLLFLFFSSPPLVVYTVGGI